MGRASSVPPIYFTALLSVDYGHGYSDIVAFITPAALDRYYVPFTILSAHVICILKNRKLRHNKNLGWDSGPGSVTPAFKCTAYFFLHDILTGQHLAGAGRSEGKA